MSGGHACLTTGDYEDGMITALRFAEAHPTQIAKLLATVLGSKVPVRPCRACGIPKRIDTECGGHPTRRCSGPCWFSVYGMPGLRTPTCVRCGRHNPRPLTEQEQLEYDTVMAQRATDRAART